MATLAMTWVGGDRLNVAELSAGDRTLIGRASDAALVLHDDTVSRHHALLRGDNGALLLENLSTTNPAAVNGQPISQPVRLSDRDVITLGAVDMTFHDLSAGDRFAGPVCSHCGRENGPDDKDCWFCGTSLVYALSGVRDRRPVLLRAISNRRQVADLYEADAIELVPGTGVRVARREQAGTEAPLWIVFQDGKALLRVAGDGDGATVNGQATSDGQPLATGDEVGTGAERATVLVR